MNQFGLIQSTANRLGNEKYGGADQKKGERQVGERPTTGMTPFGKSKHEFQPSMGDNVFRTHHRSIANEGYVGSHLGAMHTSNIPGSSDLFRASRQDYQKFQTPVTAMNKTLQMRGEETPPLFARMVPRTSKQRRQPDISPDRRATDNFMTRTDQRSVLGGFQSQHPRHSDDDRLQDNIDEEEQSTSKPNFGQSIPDFKMQHKFLHKELPSLSSSHLPMQMRGQSVEPALQYNQSTRQHLLRNPQLQASLVEKDTARRHDAAFNKSNLNQGDTQQKPLAMSFGASRGRSKLGGIYNYRNFEAEEDGANRLKDDKPLAIGCQKFSQEDLQAANKAVGDKMQVHMQISESHELNNLMNQTDVEQAVYQPLTFLPAGQSFIPDIIVKEMLQQCDSENSLVIEMSQRHPIIYFGIGSKLFVWDYKHLQHVAQHEGQKEIKVKDMVQFKDCRDRICCIKELNSVNRLAKWQRASQADESCRYVLVATDQSVRLLTVKRVPNSSELIIQDTVLQSLAQGSALNFVEFEKLGRVFYSRENGRVSELLFENTDESRSKTLIGTLMSMLTSGRKRLHSVDSQKEHIAVRVIPNFFKILAQERQVIQLRVDEQRNLLYSLCQTFPKQERIVKQVSVNLIEVFDLGMLGTEFRHQTTIQMFELVDELDESGFIKCPRRDQKEEWANQHQIVDIQSVPYSESRSCDLILTTCFSERIFIHFETAELVDDAANRDSSRTEKQLEELGIQSDFLLVNRIIPSRWRVVAFLAEFPEEEDILESKRFAQQVIFEGGIFGQHLMRDRRRLQQRRLKSRDEVQPGLVHFDSVQGLLVYQAPHLTAETDSQLKIKLGFVQKNSAGFATVMRRCREKESIPEPEKLDINEAFSMLVMPTLTAKDYIDQNKVSKDGAKEIQSFFEDERLLNMTGFTQQGQSWGALATAGFFKEQQPPVWNNYAYTLPYLASSEFDRQVYLQSGKLSVLTNLRLVQIAQLRPIDKLYTVLDNIQQSPDRSGRYDDFVDFAAAYSMEETCTMLIQILADSKAQFQFSTRTDNLVQLKRGFLIREARALNQTTAFKGGATATSLRGDFGTGTVGYSTVTRRARGMPYQTSQLGNSASRVYNARSSKQSTLNQGNFAQYCDEAGLPAEMSFEINKQLSEFNPGDGSFVALRQSQRRILNEALDLLTKFGDSIGQAQLVHLNGRVMQGEQLCNLQGEASRLTLYSYKHRGLYLYAFRILRPIWHMKVTSYTSVQHLIEQRLNRDQLLPAQERLISLLNLINSQERAFVGLTCKNKNLVPEGTQLSDDIVLNNQLQQHLCEQIEVAERQSLAQLRAFLQRCIDVIEFFCYIEHEVKQQDRPFSDLIKQLDPQDRDFLSNRMYRDFVCIEDAAESNDIVSKLLEKTIFMQVSDDANLTEHMLRNKQQQVSGTCPTLFSPLESRIFLGMSLIQNATRETDPMRQDEMVAKALDILLMEPDRIDLNRIIPMLAQLKKLTQIVAICEQKVKGAIKGPSAGEHRTGEIQELQEIIVQIATAIDRAMTGEHLDGVYADDYTALFACAAKEMRYDHLHIARENIVSLLSNSSVNECLEHLFRAFLVKNRDVDFICEKLAPHQIGTQSKNFVREQSNQEALSQPQFESIVRILSKARLADDLAQIVLDLLLGTAILVNEKTWQDEGLQGGLIVQQLSCYQRQQLTKNTIQLMDDCSKGGISHNTFPFGGTSGSANLTTSMNPRQVTGQLGSQIETRQQLHKKLSEILVSLDTQLATLKSVESKISLMESYQRRTRDANEEPNAIRDKKVSDQLQSLKEFKEQLEYGLVSHSELSQFYEQSALYDRRCIQLFQLTEVSLKKNVGADLKRLEELQRKALVDMVADTSFYCRKEEPRFKQEFQRMITTIFTNEVIQKHKGALFFIIDYTVAKHVQPNIHSLIKGDNFWIAELLVKNLRIVPSEILNHQLQDVRQSDPHGCFVQSLATMQLQVQLLNDNKVADLREAVYQDFMVHGFTQYASVLKSFCYEYISSQEQQMQMPKNEQEARRRFFDNVNAKMVNCLKQNVKTFRDEHVCEVRPAQQQQHEPEQQQQRLQQLAIASSVIHEDAEMKASAAGPVIISHSEAQKESQMQHEHIQVNRPDLSNPARDRQQQFPSRERTLRESRSFMSVDSRHQQPNQLGQSMQASPLHHAQVTSSITFDQAKPKSSELKTSLDAGEGCQLLVGDEHARQEPATSLAKMREKLLGGQ